MIRALRRHFRYHLVHYSCRMSCELPTLPAILQCVSFSSTSPQPTSFLHPARPLYPPNIPKTACGCGSLVLGGYGSFASMAGAPSPRPVAVDGTEEGNLNSTRLNILLKKLEDLDIGGHGCTPGQYNHLLCPSCKGGDLANKSLSLRITEDGDSAVWICFRGTCGWKGHVNTMNEITEVKKREKTKQMHALEPLCNEAIANADVIKSNEAMNGITEVKKREITDQMLALEPLCNELLDYFADRMISIETLRRNAVMQKGSGDKICIAFTYKRNGKLVSCKYRTINKRFWQERDTEKIFYGLDDIRNATDVIIVEGEIDKLSMEEAGFLNCVSVPNGASPRISAKDVPAPDKDTKYRYLWNCKEYLEKASRIILATDADAPGQALAEEISRRVGKERCWQVKWPSKNGTDVFKDANEVLVHLGPEALRQTIQDAEVYPIP